MVFVIQFQLKLLLRVGVVGVGVLWGAGFESNENNTKLSQFSLGLD